MNNLNLIFVLVIVALFYQNISAMDSKKFMETVSECKVMEKASDVDIVNFRMKVKPRTRSVKCFGACLFEKVGRIKNKKLDSAKLLEQVKMSKIFTEKLEKPVTELLNECKDIEDSDRCELASKLFECLENGGTKRGLTTELFHFI